MTVSYGWSIDFCGTPRAAMTLLIAFATAILGQATFAATTRAGNYDPAGDPNSMFNVTSALGAQDWWDAGYTGAGVDVALIDTGCAPVLGLNGPGKLIFGPDLSLESQAPDLAGLDTNGHGTFMAGLIAGNDAGSGAANPDPSVYRGVAPDARVVCLKVGTADGGTDVSQVIAAIDWVVQHQFDDGLNIRVLNLSYGTNSTQSYTVDPLAFAAEQAWKRGIVVVAAAGNSGYQKGKGAPGLASPAYDPYLVAVGATTRNGNGNGRNDRNDKDTKEQMAPYSASGAGCGGCRNPDLVAPGSHLQGLRVPGSFVDLSTPPGLLDARYQRGSGTSEATALVSGAAALILQKWPAATPDQVKRLLTTDTAKVPGADDRAQGKGRLDLSRLLDKRPDGAPQRFAPATGTGSLEVSRGDDHLTRDGVVLRGEIDIFGHAFDAAAMAALEAAASSWDGGVWNGNSWSGNSWSGNSWSGNSWSGNSWSGNSWSGNSWSGNSWSGNSWSGNSWSGNSWSGDSWQ